VTSGGVLRGEETLCLMIDDCCDVCSIVTMMTFNVTDSTFRHPPDRDLDLDLHLRPDPDRSVSVMRSKRLRSASKMTSSMTSPMTSQQTSTPPRGLTGKLKVNTAVKLFAHTGIFRGALGNTPPQKWRLSIISKGV